MSMREVLIGGRQDNGPGSVKEPVEVADRAEALVRLLGKRAADELGRQVDFPREKVVLVCWTSGGPPYGALRYEVGEAEVVFFVEGPPVDAPRGEALTYRASCFVVTGGLAVRLDTAERPRAGWAG